MEDDVVERDSLSGKAFHKAVKLSAEIVEIVAGEEPPEVPVERMIAISSISEEEGGFADGVAGLVKRVLGEESAKDGFAFISQGPKFSKDRKGLMSGGRTPVPPEGGAVAPMLVIEGGGKPRDVGGVIGLCLGGHDQIREWRLMRLFVLLQLFLLWGGGLA